MGCAATASTTIPTTRVTYGDPVAEYWALLEGVTLWDVGVERQIEIAGPDAFTFVGGRAVCT